MRRGWRRLAALALLVAAAPCRGWRAPPAARRGRGRLRRLAPLALLLGGARATESSEALFASLDTNLDGAVDLEEYMLHMRDLLDGEGVEKPAARRAVFDLMGQIFGACDLDGDSVLSARETEFSNRLLGVVMPVLPNGDEMGNFVLGDADVVEIRRQCDLDGDGQVDLAEFGQAWRNSFASIGAPGGSFDTPAMQQRMRKIFEHADVVADGVLVGRELQYAALLLSDYVVRSVSAVVLGAVDGDSDGTIDMREVSESLHAARRGNMPAEERLVARMRDAFSLADSDGDGTLRGEEVMLLSAALLEATARRLRERPSFVNGDGAPNSGADARVDGE